MDKRFVERLTEFLGSEIDDYGIIHDFKWCSDMEQCDVSIHLEHRPERKCVVPFRYDSDKDDLSIELYEEHWETVREFDWTVKYFWMHVAPKIWFD